MEKLILTATEASKVLSTTPSKVLAMLQVGEIPAYRDGKNWKIPKTLLQKYVEERALEETERRKYDTEAEDC